MAIKKTPVIVHYKGMDLRGKLWVDQNGHEIVDLDEPIERSPGNPRLQSTVSVRPGVTYSFV